ncbi:peptidase S8 and S53, subtilisin, kexin, sedolisin [Beggiatoa sp. PS]|nr:peptidase S8 and S53, subtilisin, kexin, sedolisin [Beggiatoa sp. PS]
MSHYFSFSPPVKKRANFTPLWQKRWARLPILGAIAVFSMGSVLPATALAATIEGVKFNDLNANGVQDSGEPGLPNETIFVRESTITMIQTGNDGKFSHESANGGNISIWTSAPPSEWTKTAPIGKTTYTLQVASDQTVTGIDFGIRDSSVPLPPPNSLPVISQLTVNGNNVPTDGVQVDERVTITLKGNFTDDDDTDTHTFEWNFGDGSATANTQEVTHVYTASTNSYSASFTVRDNQGGVDTGVVLIKVIPNAVPVINLDEDITIKVGEPVSFNGNFSDLNAIDTHTFSWDFGDGSNATAQNTSHTFNQAGEYNVKLTVTDSRNGAALDTLKVTVILDLQVSQPESFGNSILIDGIPVGAHKTTTAPSDYYYTSSGERITYQRLENYLFVMNTPGATTSVQLFNDSVLPPDTSNNPFGNGNVYKFSGEQATSQAAVQFSSQPLQTGEVEYVSPIMTTGKGDVAVVTNHIVVAKRYNPSVSRLFGRIYHQIFLSEMQRLGLSLVSKVELSQDSYVFKVTSSYTDVSKVFETVRNLNSSPYVKWSEPDLLVTPMFFDIPNDPNFGEQWHLHNTGQQGGLSDADIDAPEGWNIKKGENVIIAIHDDGVDMGHPDLDITPDGWDFAGNDNDPNPTLSTDNHGTAVAGVAAAQGNNNKGVVGSAMNAKILPIRTGSMSCSTYGDSLRYGAKYAHVANHSWGIGGCQTQINNAIEDAVKGNISGSLRGNLGTPMVFASGNDASGWKKYQISGFPAGTYSFRWKFSKDVSISSGYDTVWLDDITLPGGTLLNFESSTPGSIPSGFTSGGSQQWRVFSDGIHARGATGKSVKAGTIGHSQETYLDLNNVSVSAGNLIYWVWVSSEQASDFFDFYIKSGSGSWGNYGHYSPGQYGHQNEVGYPASNPHAIAVGASSDGWSGQEERSSYSQFGTELDVVAPSSSQGQGITTTDRVGNAGYNPDPNNPGGDLTDKDYSKSFGGTSSAAPLTSGVIAVLLSNNPTLTAEEVRNCLRAGADKIGEYDYPNPILDTDGNPIANTGERNDFYGYGRVNLERTLKACMPSPNPCDNPTVTLSSGNLSSVNSTDVVLIQNGTVTADDQTGTVVKGLCVAETGVLVGNPSVIVDASDTIRNYGTIHGKDGANANSSNPDGEDGGSVNLNASHFFNGITGKIYGGSGGNDIAYTYTSINGLSKGGNGGNVNIYAGEETINHGKIGPSPMHKASSVNPSQGCSNTTPTFYWYEFDDPNDTTAGGNGGLGSSWDGGSYHVDNNAQGGNGGLTTVVGSSITNASTGRIAGGYGGDARVYYCYSPIPGNGGGVTIIPMGGDIYGLGTIDGGDGNVWIEPRIILSDNLQIRNAENVTIFGGDDTTLSLNNLSNQAIVAHNNITLAVGKNGVVDLTGSAGDALKAGNKLEIFADTVILSDEMEMEDVSDAPIVETEDGKILYHVTLSAIGNNGEPNTTVPVKIRVVNGGPTVDTYTLVVTDSENWQLGTLPSTVTVEGLKLAEFELQVTLPATVGAEDVITVTATSQSDSSVSASAEMTVVTAVENSSEENEEESVEKGSYNASGIIRDELGNPIAGVTVQIGNSTTTTNEMGQWEITGLPEGEYTVTASKEGYPFAPANCAIGNDENCETTFVKAETVLTVNMVANPRKPQQGDNVTYTITVMNGGEETATGIVFSDVLPENVALISIEALDGGNCDAATVTCSLPDLTTGNSARVKLVISNNQGNRLENRAQVVSNEYPTDVDEKRTTVTPHLSVKMSCEPKQVAVQNTLHCTAVVELSSLAPSAATGVELVMIAPNNVELQSLNTDYGLCDTSGWPTVVCSLTDLSVDSAEATSTVTVEMENLVTDPGLLVLKHEAKVSANEYGVYKRKARNTIFVGGIEVDIAFVIDITGSMQGEMNGVIKGLLDVIAEIGANNAPLIALVTFRDEDEVELQALTSDLEALVGVIKGLKASGGGTCNEASAEAISLVIPHVKKGGTILFATDASPYPDADIEALAQQLTENGIRFNPVITGDCTDKSSWNNMP